MSLNLDRVVSVQIQKLGDSRFHTVDDRVATEEPMEIRILRVEPQGITATPISVTMRTPGNDFELAVGFLFTEGILVSPDSILDVGYAEDLPGEQRFNVVNVRVDSSVLFDPGRLQRNFYTTSSCGICGKGSLESLVIQGCQGPAGSGPTVRVSTILGLHTTLRKAQSVFEETGGLHAAGLFDVEGRLLALREDVGRHNALDKLIGASFQDGHLPLSDQILMVSGRTSFELLQKAAMAGIPLVAGVGAPSSLAVDTARAFGMTLIGFLHRDTFNVYSAPARLLADS